MNAGSRREFLATVATAGAAAGVAAAGPGRAAPGPTKLIGFTKPFTNLSFAETADLVAEVGWDGVECAVRPGTSTHIKPERVEEDLPRLVEELRKRDRELSLVTTGVVRIDAAGEKVAEARSARSRRCAENSVSRRATRTIRAATISARRSGTSGR
ncbi:MAG: twin-arginine translocation signal domain-containing protein [Planctomycetia bacterium]|nr:twin-arginine translocation signal domain-containing protein [Planctomycetia bacterium]